MASYHNILLFSLYVVFSSHHIHINAHKWFLSIKTEGLILGLDVIKCDCKVEWYRNFVMTTEEDIWAYCFDGMFNSYGIADFTQREWRRSQ